MTPTHYTRNAESLNRINILQYTANSIGVAVALPKGFDPSSLNKAASELSSMIEVTS